MSGQSRSIPDRPDLRRLKLEAKRRLATGEFSALYEAQLAIAREHGQPGWSGLKREVDSRSDPTVRAVEHLRWLTSRFRGAATAGWSAPSEDELQDHFTANFLRTVPPGELVARAVRLLAGSQGELVGLAGTSNYIQAQVDGLRVRAAVEGRSEHRLRSLRMHPVSGRVRDGRLASPATSSRGKAPAVVAEIAAEAYAELGLPGLVLAAGGPDEAPWAVATGWADLDRGEALTIDHRFPAYQLTTLITATVVLILVARGRIRLNDRANDHLRTVQLADPSITIRELLAHTGGVDGPAEPFAKAAPSLVSIAGPQVSCGGPRGVFKHSDGGYGALGQLVADVTGMSCAQVATRFVLQPLEMTQSSFPNLRPAPGTGAVTGYSVTLDGPFAPETERISSVPAAGGLWTTATDLVRFCCGWGALLPRALAREAFRPQSQRAIGGHVGLGWVLSEDGGIAGCAGDGPGASASLLLTGGHVHVAMTNRRIPIEHVNARVLRASAGSGRGGP